MDRDIIEYRTEIHGYVFRNPVFRNPVGVFAVARPRNPG